MASLKFRHYATESALKGTGTVQDALNAFDVGTIVFIDDTQKQYIITSKSNNVVTYKIYYGKAAVVGVSRRDATLTLTFSDGSEIAVKINNVEHATSADTANTAKSVAWNNVTGKPTNFVTTDDTQTITGAKTFTNNVSLQGSTSADSITTEDLIVNGAARFVSGLTGDLKGDVVGNVTGNVTGNVSGSSGSCTGNALTATTLQTARSINGTSFNGSQAITTAKWGTARNITIADNTNEHTQANNSIDGSADFTLKLPATIKADIIGNASTANSAKSVDWANVINKPNLVTTDTEQIITGAKTFNNNTTFKNETDVESLTADSLLVTGSARFTNTINGNLKGNVDGNLTGNASTATTAAICTGNSATATALTTNAGSTNIPVYFTEGKPSAISITAGTMDIERPLVVITDNNELYKTSGITANYSKNSITATTFKGNLEGNAATATTASSCTGTAANATEFSTNKAVTLTGDVTGSASSKGGWSIATTIANGAVTNAKLANSKITIAGTAVSLGGSIAASTIGAALTTSAPAAYATNAGSATKAAEATKATNDSDGNAINTTYLKKSGGTVSGALTLNGATTVNSTLTANNITADNLTVNGAAKFNGGLEGNLKGDVDGNATTATTCTGNATTATTATNLASKPSGLFTAATSSTDASLTITAGGKTSDAITIGKVKSAFTADSATTATSCSGDSDSVDGMHSSDITKLSTYQLNSGQKVVVKPDGPCICFSRRANSKASKVWTYTGYGKTYTRNTIVIIDSFDDNIKLYFYNNIGFVIENTASNIATITLFGYTQAIFATYNESVHGELNQTDIKTVSLIGHAHSYLPLTGGTVTGSITAKSGFIGDITGNATSATTATTCTGNAETATTLQNTRKINGTDFNGSADITTSKWGIARNITISDGTNSGTATSVDGSGAITLNLPGTIKANLSGNASTATKATNADRATGDSDGNTINTTYLKRSGGTVTGNVTFNSSVTADSITTEDLIVNGAGRFVSGITGDLVGNVTGNVTGNLSGNASSATNATNDGSGNTITSTYATKTERANNDITAASLNATKLTLTRAAGNITANIPTWNQDTTGTAAKATADANGNNIINTYATKAEVAALPKSMVIKGTLDATHALPTSGMTEGDTYIVGASGTYNGVVCKVGDFFVRTSDGWLRVPAGDEWEYNENTIKGIKVNNAGHADTAGTASAVAWTGITGIPDLVTTDAEQTITGNKSFKNETSIESLTADSLLVTGPARFTNNIQGDLIGNVTGYLTGNISGSSTSCSGNADNATKDGNGNNIVNTYARIDKVYDDSGSYRQFLGKNGSSSDWVRTTSNGLLPHTSGNSSNGHSSLGTSSWYFSKAYIQNIYGYLNGNISGSSTSCSGNAATATKATQDGNGNIIASSYARKISLTAPESDYTDFVILLCSLDNTYISADLYCFGTLYLKRSNILSSQIQKVDICVGKNYNSTDPIFASLSASNAHPRPKLVTCTYEGKPYVALYFYIDGSSYTTSYFIGQCSDYTSLKCIKTYCNTTKDIINEEIYNSITPIVTTEVPYVFYGLPKVSKDHGATVEDIALVSSDITGNAATATTASSCSGNSATATKAGCLDAGGMTLYAHNSNEINFGGASASSEIYFGYRATEGKPIPTSFIFGGSTGTATLTAGGFKKKDSSSSYVLTGDGGHAAISGLSVNYATSSGSCSGNSATATKATQDSDGNTINTTYLKRSGGTVTGNVTFNSSVTIDSLTTEDLIVNGSARFVSGLTGDLVGNVTGNLTGTASYATNAGTATTAGNANTIEGISASRLVYGSNSTKTTNITEDQLNAPLASGFYTISNTTTGSSATIPNATSISMILHTSYSILDNNAGFDLLINDSLTSSLHFRPATGSGKGAWKTLIDTGNIGLQSVNYATTSGACTGNAATATKLQTARTIWGQSFDGSRNISGSLTGVTNIAASGAVFSNNYGTNGNTAVAAFIFNKGGDYFGIGTSSGNIANVGFGTTTNTTGTWKSEMMTITNSGNVGIGTTSPTSKLHVAGTGYFTGDTSSAANIIAGGYIKGETVKISSGCTLEYSSTDKCVRFVFN